MKPQQNAGNLTLASMHAKRFHKFTTLEVNACTGGNLKAVLDGTPKAGRHCSELTTFLPRSVAGYLFHYISRVVPTHLLVSRHVFHLLDLIFAIIELHV